jgi:hypothetical protein
VNKKEANKRAMERWGPTARAFSHTGTQADRNSRCSLQFIEPGGLGGQPKLHVFGHGPTFDSAFAMADQDQAALYFAKWWADTLQEFEQFKGDPKRYFAEIMKKKFDYEVPEEKESTP